MTRAEFNAWIAWLRDPKNKQAKAVLHHINGGKCCLGGWVADIKKIPATKHDDLGCYKYRGKDLVLPYWKRDFYSAEGHHKDHLAQDDHVLSLAGLNDHGKTFAQIADILEANPHDYCIFQDDGP